jgi:Rha family phage regulatory protein
MESLQIISKDGQAVTSSRTVAEIFGKRHSDVIAATEKHISDLERTEKSVGWFFEANYIDAKGEIRKEYLMNRDGFSLVVMSFNNTRDVLEWKVKYIQAFNEMEKQLAQPKPMTQAQILAAIAQQSADQEQKLIELSDRTETVEQKMSLIKEALADCKESWREWANSQIKATAKARGNEYTQTYSECYKLLESKAGCNLNVRVKNAHQRLEESGATKTKIISYRRIDAVEDEPRLREIFTSIIKEMTIKYAI